MAHVINFDTTGGQPIFEFVSGSNEPGGYSFFHLNPLGVPNGGPLHQGTSSDPVSMSFQLDVAFPIANQNGELFGWRALVGNLSGTVFPLQFNIRIIQDGVVKAVIPQPSNAQFNTFFQDAVMVSLV